MARGDQMKARYGGLSGSFSAQLSQFAEQTKEKIDAVFQDICIEIGESVIMLSPVDTGRFKGNWQLTISQPSRQSLINYDKQGFATLEKLVNAANALEAGQKAFIVNNLAYSIPLEYGYSQQAPSGMVRVTLARFQQIVSDAVRANS
jgi:hypothetical protein